MAKIEDLQGQFVQEKGEKFIQLKWSAPTQKFCQNQGIELHTSLSLDSAFQKVAEHPMNSGILNYPIDYFFARTYFLLLRSKDPLSTLQSNIISVDVPTIDLPIPRITSIGKSTNGISLEWNFPFDIPDLMGFEICINGCTVSSLSKWTRHELLHFESARTVTVQIKAWSNHTSSLSKPCQLNASRF